MKLHIKVKTVRYRFHGQPYVRLKADFFFSSRRAGSLIGEPEDIMLVLTALANDAHIEYL